MAGAWALYDMPQGMSRRNPKGSKDGYCNSTAPCLVLEQLELSPGSPGIRFGFFWPKRAKKNETDWDHKPGKPRFVIPVRFGVDDNLGKPRLVIPVCFGVSWPEKPATDWDDKSGLPRVVIPVSVGVFGIFRPENPETDWDDKPGLPRVVIPVRFGVFWPCSARKLRSGLG